MNSAASAIQIYGIKNCESVKKTLKWFDEKSLKYQFHDFKKEGVSAELFTQWVQAFGLDTLMNQRGTTWRKLTPDEQTLALSPKAIVMAQKYTSILKRPVVYLNAQWLLGYQPEQFQTLVN